MNLHSVWQLLKQTATKGSADKVPRLGAALAYYTIFSVVPLLVIVIAIAGLVFGQEAAQSQIIQQIGGLVGEDSAKAIQGMIETARKPSTGLIATITALITLLLGASGVFGQLQDALNTIWGVAVKEGRGVMGMIKDRFFSFVAVLGTGFLLLVSLALSAGLAALGHVLKSWLPVPEVLLHVLNLAVSFAVITLLFALMYKVLPDATIAWNDVWTGAAVTALLFTVGKFLLGLYLGKADVAAGYGAAGSLVIVLIWVYYSSQILLFGAEFTAVYAEHYGSHIVPAENAEPAADPSTKRAGVAEEKARGSTTTRPIRTPRPEEGRSAQPSNSIAQDLGDLPWMRGSMGEKLAQFEDQVQVTIQDSKANLLAVIDHVKETADDFIDSAEGFVQHTKQTFDPTPQMARHPWMMLSGALVVGYVFGTLPIRHTRNDGHQHVVPGRTLKRLTEVKPSALHPMEAGK